MSAKRLKAGLAEAQAGMGAEARATSGAMTMGTLVPKSAALGLAVAFTEPGLGGGRDRAR